MCVCVHYHIISLIHSSWTTRVARYHSPDGRCLEGVGVPIDDILPGPNEADVDYAREWAHKQARV